MIKIFTNQGKLMEN